MILHALRLTVRECGGHLGYFPCAEGCGVAMAREGVLTALYPGIIDRLSPAMACTICCQPLRSIWTRFRARKNGRGWKLYAEA